MNLEDLFVSYKQVEPVKYEVDTPTQVEPIYLNIERARKASEIPKTEVKSDLNTSDDISSWKVKSLNEIESGSRNLLTYLKTKEGFKSSVYRDSGGVETIGYGFTDPSLIAKKHMTEEEASILLQQDVQNRIQKLKQQITTWDELNQNQKDALISYGYNVGVENWAKYLPRLLAALNERRFKEAALYMDAVKDKKGNVLPGLVIRRKEERDWFNS